MWVKQERILGQIIVSYSLPIGDFIYIVSCTPTKGGLLGDEI